MADARLSPLDASFLAVESATAPMHVGWAALFEPPEKGPRPSFEDLREHVRRRLARAPRFRQKMAAVPLGLNDPLWVDDLTFDVGRHVRRAEVDDISELTDRVMSAPLDREVPLWEIWIAERLADGRVGLVGKAHHCMVDGLAAVELGSLLLDDSPRPPQPEVDSWRPGAAPGPLGALGRGLADRAADQLGLLRLPARYARSPKRLFDFPAEARRAARALADSLYPATPGTPLNEPISSRRHLATVARPFEDLATVKRRFHTTVNDVVLAASAGAVRSFFLQRERTPVRLKAMVPVSVRGEEAAGAFGNRLSFMFIPLPCDEPDPLRRLREIHMETLERKQAGVPRGADAVLKALSHTPHRVQEAVSQLVSSPRAFNLVISNIPGPRLRLYMHGCELQEVYPVVPIADRHAVSIGVTTVRDGAFFGLYSDPRSLPDADRLARNLDEAIDELLAMSR